MTERRACFSQRKPRRLPLRRVLSGALALVLTLGMAAPAAFAWADSYQFQPTLMVATEAPTVNFELNFVKDGEAIYMELGLRFSPGYTEDATSGEKTYQAFSTLGAALQYNTEVLTPVTWDDTTDATAVDKIKINTSGTSGFENMVGMPTLKNSAVKLETASAHVSGADSSSTDGKWGYLYLNAHSDKPFDVPGDTWLMAVRFLYEGTTDVDKITNPTTLVTFAPYEIQKDYYYGLELYYDSADNGMFYSANASTPNCIGRPVTIDGAPDYVKNNLTVSSDNSQVEPQKINFSLSTKRGTYNTNGDTVILFYDWDDTLIGTLVVDGTADNRKAVNDYVRDNLIYHNGTDDLRLGVTGTATPAQVSSLSRADNYRGKYPTTPQPDGTTDQGEVTDGEDYPLTNKLDYVFFKRPMEKQEGSDNTWVQKTSTSDGSAVWVEEEPYPYIYGWAAVDAAHPENTWTTLGAGELSYTDYTSITGGATTNSGKPAELTVNGETFAFADFDFSATSAPGSCYAVKAVYEPGVDLLDSSYAYRMIQEPYYNKYNSVAAYGGGAYEVETVYERATTNSDGLIEGVQRMRDPYVRQDTTSDLRWEESSAGVRLSLASFSEAYTDRTKTTYTKVEVTNTEQITVSLTLSARQNKINYYLVESYKSNFISGVTRTTNDSNRSRDEATADNYNYLVSGDSDDKNNSDINDEYWDADEFNEKEGTFGFVLLGTINNFMDQATQFNRGEITGDDFNQYVTLDTLSDVNIKLSGGISPAYSQLNLLVRPAIQEAARQAEAAHDSGNNTWWNVAHDHAQLTYHQLQHFILDYQNDSTSAKLEADDGDKITWCHLHQDCVNATSGKPTTWEDLMKAAYENRTDDLGLLTADDIEKYFHLRKDANGTKYATADLSTFVADIQSAVAAIKGLGVTDVTAITWDQVQYYLDKKITGTATATAMNDYGAANYWWYDGATSHTISSWEELDKAVKAATDGLSTDTLPDGRPVSGREAKLSALDNDSYYSDHQDEDVSAAWIAATHNLVQDGEVDFNGHATRFSSYTAFLTAAKETWIAASKAATPITNPTWNQVQFHIIHRTTFPEEDDPDDSDYPDGYWWFDGGKAIVNLRTLLSSAANNSTSWQRFTLNDLDNLSDCGFRATIDAKKYQEGTIYNLSAFKSAIEGYVSVASSNTNFENWNWVQFYLIHSVLPKGFELSNEQGYYWWRPPSGSPPSGDYSNIKGDNDAAANADNLASALSDAGFGYTYNGWTNNADTWGGLTDDLIKAGRLVTDVGTNYGSDGFDFTSATVQQVKSAVSALLSNPLPASVPTTLTWEAIQGQLLSDSGSSYSGDYWWKSKDVLGKSGAENFSDFLGYIEAVYNGGSPDDLVTWFTEDVAASMEMTPDYDGGTWGDFGISLSDIDWSNLDYSGAGCEDGGSFSITYAQIFAMLLNYQDYGDFVLENADDASYYVLDYWCMNIPDWVSEIETASVYAASVMDASLDLGSTATICTQADRLIRTLQDGEPLTEEDLASLEELRALLDTVLPQEETEQAAETVVGGEEDAAPVPVEDGETEAPTPDETVETAEDAAPAPVENGETEAPTPDETVETAEDTAPTPSEEDKDHETSEGQEGEPAQPAETEPTAQAEDAAQPEPEEPTPDPADEPAPAADETAQADEDGGGDSGPLITSTAFTLRSSRSSPGWMIAKTTLVDIENWRWAA